MPKGWACEASHIDPPPRNVNPSGETKLRAIILQWVLLRPGPFVPNAVKTAYS